MQNSTQSSQDHFSAAMAPAQTVASNQFILQKLKDRLVELTSSDRLIRPSIQGLEREQALRCKRVVAQYIEAAIISIEQGKVPEGRLSVHAVEDIFRVSVPRNLKEWEARPPLAAQRLNRLVGWQWTEALDKTNNHPNRHIATCGYGTGMDYV